MNFKIELRQSARTTYLLTKLQVEKLIPVLILIKCLFFLRIDEYHKVIRVAVKTWGWACPPPPQQKRSRNRRGKGEVKYENFKIRPCPIEVHMWGFEPATFLSRFKVLNH